MRPQAADPTPLPVNSPGSFPKVATRWHHPATPESTDGHILTAGVQAGSVKRLPGDSTCAARLGDRSPRAHCRPTNAEFLGGGPGISKPAQVMMMYIHPQLGTTDRGHLKSQHRMLVTTLDVADRLGTLSETMYNEATSGMNKS